MVLTRQVLQLFFKNTATLFSLQNMFRLCTWAIRRDQTSGRSDKLNITFRPFGLPQIKSKKLKTIYNVCMI